MSAPERSIRREWLVSHLATLGERALAEFLAELEREHGIGEDIDGRLERYARLDPAILEACGATVFPPRLFEVKGFLQ